MSTPWQPLRTSRSRNSSSCAALMLDWLTQRISSGTSARKNSFAWARLDVMLSSTKKNSFLRAADGCDLGDDLVERPAGLGCAEHALHGAEVAFEMAAAAGLDQADGQVALAAKDAAIGPQPASEGRAVGAVEASSAGRGGSRR